MLDIYLFEPDREHGRKIREICTAYAVKYNIDQRVCIFEKVPESLGDVDCGSQTAVFIISGNENLPILAKCILNLNPRNYTVLIAEEPAEVMKYISVSFRPSGVMIKPVNYEAAERIFNDIYADYKRAGNNPGQFRFKIRSREYSVCTDSILYFEADSKKVSMRTAGQAFEFYMSMEQIMSELPEWFARIHKSYIVNIRHIAVVDHKNMTVTMDDMSRVYISRTYKENLQAAMKGGEK